MPGCSVIGCKNRSEHGYRMFLLPQGERNEDRRKLWVTNIGRPDLPNKSVVCEAHFTSDQFENKRLDNKRLLKWNAVPTIFPAFAPDSNKRTRKVSKKLPAKSNINNETTSNECNTNSVLMPDSDSGNAEISTSANNNDSSPCVKRSTRKRKIKFTVNDIYSSNIDKTLLEECHESTKKSVKSPSNFRKKKPVGNKTCSSRLENFAEVISTKTTPKRVKFAVSSDKGPPFSTKVVRVSTENICRICGKLSDALVPVFYSGNDTEEEDIPSLINTLLPIKISAEDIGWPKNVCEICLNNLAEWNKMYIKCKEVDSAFRKILNKPTETSDNFDIEVPIISLIGHDYCPTYMTHPARDKNDASGTSSEEENLYVTNEEDTDKLLMSVDVGEGEGDDVDDYDKENESLQHSKAKPIEKSNSGKQYKIGITLVKNKDCNEDAALNLNSLKSILVTKVNQLFQSICNDETIGKSLVNKSEDHDDDNTSDAEWNNVTNRYSGNNLGVIKSNVLKQASHRKRNLVISRVSSISKRMESFNKNDGPYLCSKCGHVSLRRRAYLKHLRLFHVERKCNYCDAILPSSSDYKKHLRLMHYEKISINRCEICDTTFIKKERLERHKLIIHNIGEYHHCDICNRKCASKQQLHSHKNDVHRKQENLCQDCGRMFASYRKMLTHWKIFHSPQSNVAQKIFYCSICNRQFKRSGALAIHNFTMHNIEYDRSTITRLSKSVANTTFSCLICNVRITDMELLKQHMDYHMNDEEVKKLSGNDVGKIKCLLCNKYFEKEKDLGLHRYFYHKEMPFVCSTDGCLSSFWKKTALVVHQLSEHKTRSYSCTMCSETFEDFRIKRRHMIKNHPGSSNTKTFSCNVCNKQFNTKYSLNVHMVMHSDEREHKCIYCGKEFKLKFTLSRHLQHHQKHDYLADDNVKVKKRNSISIRTFDVVRNQTNIPTAVNETSELVIENNGTIVQNLPVLSGIPTKPIKIVVVKK